jgi:hypothetical protein
MAKKPPAHTGGFGGWGNTKFPGGKQGGGGGSGQQHKRAHHHKHTGGFGGLGNTKFPGGKSGKGGKKPPVKPGGTIKRARKHPKRHLAGPALDGWWITGGNDVADNCAAVAVANSLLLATGCRVADGELLRLHDRAGPLSIPEALAAASIWPGCSLLDALTCENVIRDSRNCRSAAWPTGTLLGLATPHGPHAALLLGDALVTWGGVTDWPDDWLLEEAWEVRW